MTSVLGFELSRAVSLLTGEGCRLSLLQTASKTGPVGDEDRVIRQRVLEDGTVELVYARFRTHIEENGGM